MYSENGKPQLSLSGTKMMEGNMQVSYSAKISKQKQYKELMEKKQKEEMLQEIKEQKEQVKEGAEKQTISNLQEQIQHYQEQQAEKTPRKPAFKRLKSFKEMEIIEKLEYLLNFPKQLPPVPCLVITANENVRGFVIDLKEDKVDIKLMDQTTITLNIPAIQEVRMIGI
ncbi:CotO family spore coat protein [Niallia alba]|uniref:Spore coat protein CotO n=1 Tax=Niallia circulans TaxID=1397 RepID=A0A941GJA5_NIACI|nr:MULTISPECIES: CotO family spore coat protein [Niallia]MCB5236765.1 spore coat CotO family protein [Niallia circulans]MED3793525.1 CotO family spore coat protein [Niallia alba]